MRSVVRLFKVLSDETRLRILNILMVKECCVCEVMQALDISQSRASRNLNILYNTGLLRLKRDGLWALYSIDKEALREFETDIIEIVAKALQGNDLVIKDKQRLKTAVRTGTVCSPEAM